MTPYHIDTRFNGMWIDLDHILAIGDFTERNTPATRYYPRASFTVILASQSTPIQFAVYDTSTLAGFSDVLCTIDYTYTRASASDVSELKHAYDQLLIAWKNNRE